MSMTKYVSAGIKVQLASLGMKALASPSLVKQPSLNAERAAAYEREADRLELQVSEYRRKAREMRGES